MPVAPDALSLLDDLIRKAKAAGADAADAVLFDSASLSLSQRLGKPERLERIFRLGFRCGHRRGHRPPLSQN